MLIRVIKKVDEIIKREKTKEEARVEKKSFTRKRKMGFEDIIYYLMDMRKTTLQTRANKYMKGKKGKKISEQAISKARNKMDHSPFETMVRELVEEEYKRKELKTWQGYYVFGIDGSYYILPKNEELRAKFGTRGEGSRCVSAGSSVLYDVLNNWPIDPILTHSNMNERAECEKHLEYLCEKMPEIAKKSLILIDRGYPSVDLFKAFNEREIKFLARCAKNYCKATENAPMGDSVVELSKGLSVRVFKFVLETGEVETLITNLFDVSSAEFPALYAMRWGIETFYFKLKKIVCIEKFSGRTENTIRQDFWASCVVMIAVNAAQHDADALIALRHSSKSNKYSYIARSSDLVVTLRDNFIFAVFQNDPHASLILLDIIECCSYSITPIIPDRHFPRSFSSFPYHDNLKSHL